ncbi:MAG TPA: TPM domain-containing protein [Hyphomicrobiaceae bacterium]|nr:TPM domain-containing protein [Hyphomicrobiaceae bacterium]
MTNLLEPPAMERGTRLPVGARLGSAVRAGAGLWLLACVLLATFSLAALAQPKFPPLTGRIVDEAGLLSSADRAELTAALNALEAKSTDQLVVYTTRSLQGYPIEDFGYQLGRTWQIGQKDKNNGVVLIVAPNERKVRIEVGRGLEPQLTDAMSKLIIENAILPAFRRGDFAAGIKAGVRDITDVLLGDAEAVKERARVAAKRTSGNDPDAIFVTLLILAIVIFVMVQTARSARQAQRSGRYRRPGDDNVIVIPGGWGGSGGWSGGDGGGGGWSGGGGDFGGGGSSGSW